MRNDLLTYLEELKARGLAPEREKRLRAELATVPDGHGLPPDDAPLKGELARFGRSIYADGDLLVLQQAVTPHLSSAGLAMMFSLWQTISSSICWCSIQGIL